MLSLELRASVIRESLARGPFGAEMLRRDSTDGRWRMIERLAAVVTIRPVSLTFEKDRSLRRVGPRKPTSASRGFQADGSRGRRIGRVVVASGGAGRTRGLV